MAKIEFKKGDEYIARINKLSRELRQSVAGPAIYEAAGMVADKIKERLNSVPTDESWGSSTNPKAGPKKIELVSVSNALGIASLQDNSGYINVKIGFDGYNSVKTSQWPNGQPNQMLARSIERGTYFMSANPFVKPAVASTRGKALDTMRKIVDEEIAKIMKG